MAKPTLIVSSANDSVTAKAEMRTAPRSFAKPRPNEFAIETSLPCQKVAGFPGLLKNDVYIRIAEGESLNNRQPMAVFAFFRVLSLTVTPKKHFPGAEE